MKVKNLLDDNNTTKPVDEPEKNLKRLPIEVFSPWANVIVKFKIPDEIFSQLLDMYEDTMKDWKSFGRQLVGQIDEEPEVKIETLNKYPEWARFCMDAVRNYVYTQNSVTLAAEKDKLQAFMKEELLTKINTMWFVNQKPGEYNPAHIHTNCKVSAIAYLKTPKQQVKDRKVHYSTDGKVTFMNNTGTDNHFANSQCSFDPVAGEMYVFGAMQHHMVWPYRSADPDDLRVSISYNADVTTATELKAKEKMEKEMVKYYNDNNLLDNSEVKNDKSTDVSDINKSG